MNNIQKKSIYKYEMSNDRESEDVNNVCIAGLNVQCSVKCGVQL